MRQITYPRQRRLPISSMQFTAFHSVIVSLVSRPRAIHGFPLHQLNRSRAANLPTEYGWIVAGALNFPPMEAAMLRTLARLHSCWLVALLGSALLLTPTIAHAELVFCNKSSVAMDVAVAYVPKDAPGTSTGGDRSTRVEGWWKFAPGECAQVLSIDAGAHWVSWYAENRKAGRYLTGPEPRFCVPDRKFEEQQRVGTPCRQGYREVKFKRDETRARTHTFTLN